MEEEGEGETCWAGTDDGDSGHCQCSGRRSSRKVNGGCPIVVLVYLLLTVSGIDEHRFGG